MSGRLVRTAKPLVPAPMRRVLNRTVRRPARRLAGRAVSRTLEAKTAEAGLHRITDVFPEDVVIARYPKSGSTWFGALVAGAAFGLDLSLAPTAFLDQLVPGMHSALYYRRFQTPMFFKSHLLPRPEYRRVVYVVRDGRDVMVSYLHHLRRTGAVDESVDLLRLVETGRWLFPSKWHEHVEAWEENPYGAEKMTIRYEDLVEDPVRELRRFCRFVGIEREGALLASVAEQATFERLQEKERKAKEEPGRKLPAEKLFFRRGQTGSHRDEMPPEALAAFLDQAGPTLRKLGYPMDGNLGETRTGNR